MRKTTRKVNPFRVTFTRTPVTGILAGEKLPSIVRFPSAASARNWAEKAAKNPELSGIKVHA